MAYVGVFEGTASDVLGDPRGRTALRRRGDLRSKRSGGESSPSWRTAWRRPRRSAARKGWDGSASEMEEIADTFAAAAADGCHVRQLSLPDVDQRPGVSRSARRQAACSRGFDVDNRNRRLPARDGRKRIGKRRCSAYRGLDGADGGRVHDPPRRAIGSGHRAAVLRELTPARELTCRQPSIAFPEARVSASAAARAGVGLWDPSQRTRCRTFSRGLLSRRLGLCRVCCTTHVSAARPSRTTR